jgi:hypothetical protein
MPFLEELVFYHAPSSTLILTDIAFNFVPEAEQPMTMPQGLLGSMASLYLKLAGGHRRCCMTKPFWFLIKDPGAFLVEDVDVFCAKQPGCGSGQRPRYGSS